MRKQAEEWLLYSKIDLKTAEKILLEEDISRSTAFHCHQSVEKAFKALLENIEYHVPKTHDLQRLFKVLREEKIELDIEIAAVTELDSVYVDSRYPVDLGLVPEGTPTRRLVK